MEDQDLELEIKALYEESNNMDEFIPFEERVDNVVDYIMQWSDFTNQIIYRCDCRAKSVLQLHQTYITFYLLFIITMEKLKKIIKEIDTNYNIDVYSNIDWNEIAMEDSVDSIIEYIRVLNEDYLITDENVIYDDDAMEYLMENDPSLQKSLEIASGYAPDQLSSRFLATLLISENNLAEFDEFLEELRESLEQLEQ